MNVKRWLRSARRRVSVWVNYWYSYTSIHSPQTKFIYFAFVRSGSHLFADLMNSHPQIRCVTEHQLLLTQRGIRDPYRYIDGVSKSRPALVFGGKIDVHQLARQNQKAENVIATLHSAGWKFIRLQRENVLDQAISNQVAVMRKRYHDTSTPLVNDMRITIEPSLLQQQMAYLTEIERDTTQLLAPYDPLSIVYEFDLIDAKAQQATADRVFTFLGIDAVPVQTKYVKTAIYPLSEYVVNYDELVKSLQGTEFERWISA